MYKRVVNEIGSEFWEPEKQGDAKYFLTGRTALEFIIRDILAEHAIKSVLMPSYCCHTMIMPFVLHDIEVRFYDVYYDRELNVELPEFRNNEIFYFIRYFGFDTMKGIDIEAIRRNYQIIIEDQTHSWMGRYESIGDYTFVSYKKWIGISGLSRASKRCGKFLAASLVYNESFNNIREKAFDLKKQYIETGMGDKTQFLDLFEEAEKLIETDYCSYGPSMKALEQLLEMNTVSVRAVRRQNAEYLMEELGKIPNIEVMYKKMEDNNVPLFVPIQVTEGRNKLRHFLIQENIYLPVHWPLSNYHNRISERARLIYDQELSVVCDQRYDINDMSRIVNTIQDYYQTR